MTGELLQTPLHDRHVALGSRMVEFAGWSMPVQYDSIIAEHNAVRNAIGVFDVSHMGRFEFQGDARDFLDSLVTRRVNDMQPGQIRYSLITNEAGGILDDVLVYCLPSGKWGMVVNASNREKIAAWITARLPAAITLQDQTQQTAMIAVQGPAAVPLVDSLIAADLPGMKYYHGEDTEFAGLPAFVSRTGYTGEDGCELTVAAENAVAVWDRLFEVGQSHGVSAAGLGARDTLRLEAAMPLYGHELSEDIHPLQAGLSFAVNFKDREFIGKSALQEAKAAGGYPQRVGVAMDGRRAPREGCSLLHQGTTVGHITSGTFSPTLQKSIGMGYVAASAAEVGASLQVDIRGKLADVEVVQLPFYKR